MDCTDNTATCMMVDGVPVLLMFWLNPRLRVKRSSDVWIPQIRLDPQNTLDMF